MEQMHKRPEKKSSEKHPPVQELLPMIRTKTNSAMDVINKSSKKEKNQIT